MNKLSVGKMWLLLAILMMLLSVAACGPAQPPNGAEDSGEETAVAAQNEQSASVPEIGTSDDGIGLLTPSTPVPLPTPAPGAVVTGSGLQYLETQAGAGPNPADGDIVELHLIAEMADGTLLGDTYSQGAPIKVILGAGQLFPGLEEGVTLMQAGGKASLVIPPDLIVDKASAGLVAPPEMAFLIDVELISVEPAPQPTAVSDSDYTTTASGLQYYDISVGTGDTPTSGDSVTVDFVIWLEDGSLLASSALNGAPVTFSLGDGFSVFPGWDEGVATMNEGGERLLRIPPDLALGEAGAPGVPPNSTLLMEVTLVSFRAAPKIAAVDAAEYTETESGLKYVDLVVGSGATPAPGDTVEVNYTGWLEDGTKFDSSLDAGRTFTFVLGAGQVIAGWDEGVATMRVGTTRQLMIPAELAYGEAGAGGLIPPGATLIFQVELLDIR